MASTAAQVAFNSGWSVRAPQLVSSNCDFRSWAANTSLGTLPPEALRELESIMSIVDYDAGSILFLEQEQLSQVFVVLAGDVRLSQEADPTNCRARRRTWSAFRIIWEPLRVVGRYPLSVQDCLDRTRGLSPFSAALSRGISPCDSRADDNSQGRRCIATYRGTDVLRSQKIGVTIINMGRTRQQNWRRDTVSHGSDPCSDRGVYRRSARVCHAWAG
jgi:hypothetical protein